MVSPKSAVGSDWGAHQQGCLKAAVTGGLWPEERLFNAGLAPSNVCQSCFGAVGNGTHRLYGCANTAPFREEYNCPIMFQQAAQYPDLPLWTRALLPDPSWHYPKPCMEMLVHWVKRPENGCLDGIGYGDGSGINPRWRRIRRCGWGLAVFSQ
eukprot:9837268-Karenia_brevis.AAC.1